MKAEKNQYLAKATKNERERIALGLAMQNDQNKVAQGLGISYGLSLIHI